LHARRTIRTVIESLTWLYPWLKYGHILMGIVAVGFNFSFAILIRRAAAEPQHLGHVLRTVKLLTTDSPTRPTASCSSWAC
jgi:hypothetical protein